MKKKTVRRRIKEQDRRIAALEKRLEEMELMYSFSHLAMSALTNSDREEKK